MNIQIEKLDNGYIVTKDGKRTAYVKFEDIKSMIFNTLGFELENITKKSAIRSIVTTDVILDPTQVIN